MSSIDEEEVIDAGTISNDDEEPESEPEPEPEPERPQQSESNIEKVSDPCKNVQSIYEKEKIIRDKLAAGKLSKMTQPELSAHRNKMNRFSRMMSAMASENTDTPFVLDRVKHRCNVIPADHTLSVVQRQKPITPELVGDSEIGAFIKAQYDSADRERNNGLHKKSIKLDMLPFAEAIIALPASDHEFLLEHLNPRYAYDADLDTTHLEKLHGAKRQTAIINEAHNDYWTEIQKVSRLFPAILAGAPGTAFRGTNASKKIFMLLFMAITGLSEVPEAGSDLAKSTAAKFFSHFFVHTNKKVEPIAATDGFPVKKGKMARSIEEGEVYSRPANDVPGSVLCELVYTCSFADTTLKPFQAWCPNSNDFRDVLRVGPRLLEFIFDFSKRLLGDATENVPFLIRCSKQWNPKCREVFNTATLSESICSDPSIWSHPTSDNPTPSHSQTMTMLRSWANSPYTNPSLRIVTLNAQGAPVESSKVLFYSKQREQEMVEETMLRVTAYDSDTHVAAGLSAFRSAALPILGRIVSAAASLESSIVIHNDVDPVAAAAGAAKKPRKRKSAEAGLSDDKYVTVMDAINTIATKVGEVSEKLDSLTSSVGADITRSKKFRETTRAKLKSAAYDLALIKNQVGVEEEGEEEADNDE